MKITMYELLGLVKDGKAPKKIKYDGIIWEYDGDYYVSKNNLILEEYCNLTTSLNDEVEIIEEEKKIPEKLDVISWDKCIHGVTHKEKELAIEINKTQELLNQVIDYLKSKGDE